VNVGPIIRELDRLATRLAAALAFGGTFGPPGGEQLELFEPAKKFRG